MVLRAVLLSVLLLPNFAAAEVYKWRESNGVMRYSDVPPPSNVKLELVQGRPVEESKGLPPLAPVAGDVTIALKRSKTQLSKQTTTPPSEKSDAWAAEELSVKQKNCKAAQANLMTYQMGGRIAKVNDKGERAMLSSQEIAQAKLEAQADIKQYCD